MLPKYGTHTFSKLLYGETEKRAEVWEKNKHFFASVSFSHEQNFALRIYCKNYEMSYEDLDTFQLPKLTTRRLTLSC